MKWIARHKNGGIIRYEREGSGGEIIRYKTARSAIAAVEARFPLPNAEHTDR